MEVTFCLWGYGKQNGTVYVQDASAMKWSFSKNSH